MSGAGPFPTGIKEARLTNYYTNSGKSSLALSLLRLNETVSGQILIDGQDISLISRSSIRQRISCLSQEPFLFPGTIRQNADPLNILASQDIVDALRCVGVWDALLAHHDSHGEAVLDAKLNESVLSQGQKQLFCLARALLKKSKILILDEPTSRYVHGFCCLIIFVRYTDQDPVIVWTPKPTRKYKRSSGNHFGTAP
jgi:ABC-type multidrug transport system fused ATPase/permease subunit